MDEGWVLNRLQDAIEDAWRDGASLGEINLALLGARSQFDDGELTSARPVYERPVSYADWQQVVNADETAPDGRAS